LEITALWSDTAGGGMLAVHDHFHKRPLFEEVYSAPDSA